MVNIRKLLVRENIWVLALVLGAVLVGILYVAPSVLVAKKLQTAGQPFVLLQLDNHGDEVEGYVARARQIYNGQFPPEPAIFPWLTTSILAASMVLFSGNVGSAYLAIVFVFSALIFVSFFLTARFFLKNDYWAMLLAFAGSLTPMATHLPYAFSSLANFSNIVIKNFYPAVSTPLVRLFLARVDNPLLTLPFYLLAICLLFWFWKNPNWKSAILSAVSVGILSQIYFHYWAFLVVVSVLLGVYALWRVRSDAGRFKMFLVFFAVLAVVSLPYFINYLNLKISASPDFFQRFEMEHGRNFRFSRMFDYGFYAVLALLIGLYLRKVNRDLAIFFVAFVAAMFIVWNLQLITGFQPELKWDKPISPAIFLILSVAAYYFCRRFEAKRVAVVLLILMSLLVVKKFVNAAIFLDPPSQFLNEHTFDADLVSAWQWMNSNLPKGAVVASPFFADSYYFAVYTSAEPLMRPGLSTSISNQLLEERFLASNKLFGVSRAIVEKRLRKTLSGDGAPDRLYYGFYKDQSFDVGYRNDFDDSLRDWSIPEEKIRELLRRYDEISADPTTSEADYLYYGPDKQGIASVDFSDDKNLELVYGNASVKIYKVSTNQPSNQSTK